MILLVDVGNTRLKWRYIDCYKEIKSAGFYANEEFDKGLAESLLAENDLTALYLSNVGYDDVIRCFEVIANQRHIDFKCVKVQKHMLGLSFIYEQIDNLGVDRALAMIGAYDTDGVLVIDAGSAITADYIAADGHHLGGYILPGYAMTNNLLVSKTAKVGVVAGLGDDALGTSTESCVNNGLNLLMKSTIQGLLNKATSLGIKRCVVTGGDAGLFQYLGGASIEFKDNLVLDGLYKYAFDESAISGN